MDVKQKKKSCKGKLIDSDRFSESFSFNLDRHGKTALPSVSGALLGLLMFVLLTVFTGYKMDNVAQRRGAQMTTTVKEDYFGLDDHFGS